MAARRQTHSLRRVVLAWLLTPLIVLLPLVATVQYRYALHLMNDAFDRSLGDDLAELSSLVQWTDGRVSFELTRQGENVLRNDTADKVYYLVLDAHGQRVAGDAELQSLRQMPDANVTHFFDATAAGDTVRVASRGVTCGPDTCEVLLAETLVKRSRIGTSVLVSTLLIALALFSVGTIAVLLAVRRGFDPLERLSDEIGQRSLDDLRPLDVTQAPREMAGVIRAVNRLFARVQAASSAQRAFLADAAHQLRTPLARLQTEVELALLETDAAPARSTLERVAASARRTARLAHQMLALARADEAAQVDPPAPFDLKVLASELVEEWVPRAIAADVDLGFELAPAHAFGRENLVRELLINLVHNAIEHAGAGARVTVRTLETPDAALLEVEDDGPGIAPEDRGRVFERFTRGAQPRGDGTGLGLAIVRDIAAQHGARVELLDPPGATRGLLVRVRFAQRGR